jgi:CO dehydrogenase maturation factor
LNPDVDDVFERFAIPVRDRLHLLVMGSLETPVSGCRCPEHALITAILRYLAHRNRDAVIIDAGGIHPPEELFGVLFPHALIITEPTFNSLRIAEQVTRQALDREVPHLHLVVNKIRTERDVEKVKEFATGLTCYEHVFSLPYEEGVQYADPDVSGLLGRKTELMEEVWKLYRVLQATPMNQEQAEVSD